MMVRNLINNKKYMAHNYYPNKLLNENYVAKPNSVWLADITEFEFNEGKKVYVFFCLDIFSNVIITSIFWTKTITSSDITKKLEEVIDKRFPIIPRRKLITHTDRGSQFTSQNYKNFIDLNESIIELSMSRKNQPPDNAVAERFMKTFKK